MFPSLKVDLSVEVQTASRVLFVFVFSGFHQRKNTCERRDSGRESDVDAQRRFGSTGMNILLVFTALVVGSDDVAPSYCIGVLRGRQVGRREGSRGARIVASH